MNKQSENILYVRSDLAGGEKSDFQIEYASYYAKQHSLSFHIIEDVGMSGTRPLDERPGMTKILELLEAGVVKTLIVSSFTIISKNLVGVPYLYSLLGKQKVRLIILDEVDMNPFVQQDSEIEDLTKLIESNSKEIYVHTANKVNIDTSQNSQQGIGVL